MSCVFPTWHHIQLTLGSYPTPHFNNCCRHSTAVRSLSTRVAEIRAVDTIPALVRLYKARRSQYGAAELCAAFEAASVLASRSPGAAAPGSNPKARTSIRGRGRSKAKAGPPPPSAEAITTLLNQLHSQLYPQLDSCSTRHLTQLVRAMGRSGYVPQPAFLQGIVRRLRSAMAQAQVLAQAEQQQAQPLTQPQPQVSGQAPRSKAAPGGALSPRELCDVAEGLSKLQCYEVQLFDGIARQAVLGLEGFTAQELTSMARSMARVLHYDAELMERLLARMAAATAAATAADAEATAAPPPAGTLAALAAKAKAKAKAQAQAEAEAEAATAAPAAAAAAAHDAALHAAPSSHSPLLTLVTDCLFAAATLGHAGDACTRLLQRAERWVEAHDLPSPQEVRRTANPVGLRQAAPLAWAAGLLGHRGPQLYRRLLSCVEPQAGQGGGQSVKSLAMVMQGLLAAAVAAGGRADMEGVRRVLGLPPAPPEAQPQGSAAGTAGPGAEGRAEEEAGGRVAVEAEAGVEARLLACCEAWLDVARRSTPSGTQFLVAGALGHVEGVEDIKVEALTQGGMFCVDIMCRWRCSPLVLEVDGDQHCCSNAPGRQLGATACRTRMLRSLGYAVVRLPVEEWHAAAEARGVRGVGGDECTPEVLEGRDRTMAQYLQQCMEAALGG